MEKYCSRLHFLCYFLCVVYFSSLSEVRRLQKVLESERSERYSEINELQKLKNTTNPARLNIKMSDIVSHRFEIQVNDLRVGNQYGYIEWPGWTPINNLSFDHIVSIRQSTISVYEKNAILFPEPPRGNGLNKHAILTLRQVRPQIGKDMDAFEESLKRSAGNFISYDRATGDWKFQVDHFSRYGLPSKDDEKDDPDNDLPVYCDPIGIEQLRAQLEAVKSELIVEKSKNRDLTKLRNDLVVVSKQAAAFEEEEAQFKASWDTTEAAPAV